MATTDEIIVRFTAEGGDTVEEAFRRVGAGADRATGSTTRASASLDGLRLKSDERVARNLGAIAQEFARGGSAADIMAVSVSRLGESFKGAFTVAAASAVGFGLYETITRTGEAAIKLNSEVAGLTRSRGSANFLGTDQINKDLNDIGNKIQQIYAAQVQRSHSLFSSLLGTGGQSPTAGIIPALNKEDQKKINELRKSAVGTIDDLAKKTENLNRVEIDRTHISELQAKLDAAEIDHQERLGAIARTAVLAGVSGKAAADQENIRFNLQQDELRKEAELRQRNLQLQRDVIGVEKELRPAAEENLKIIDAKIAATRNLLDTQKDLTDVEREQYEIQLGQLEATKQRAAFARKLETDLANLELRRVRGGVGSDRAAILEKQRLVDQQAAQNPNSPETNRAEAGLEDEQFKQFQEYEKDPGAFRQRRINEQHERERFQYLRNTGQLPDEIASSRGNARDTGANDFSGIASLAGLKFEGLLALDNLSLSIQ